MRRRRRWRRKRRRKIKKTRDGEEKEENAEEEEEKEEVAGRHGGHGRVGYACVCGLAASPLEMRMVMIMMEWNKSVIACLSVSVLRSFSCETRVQF